MHRIDKNTSGLLVLAKTEAALASLAKQFFDHTVSRRYQALVWGDMEQDAGTIVAHIGRHRKMRKLFDVYPEGDYGKHAITHYQVLERLCYVTLLECILETGVRTRYGCTCSTSGIRCSMMKPTAATGS